jgi:exo-1,4-beta-D-glucosaminidase
LRAVWISGLAVFIASLALGSCAPAPPAEEPLTHHVALADGWQIRAAAEVAAGGAEISSPGFDAAGWVPAAVPSTVLGALVEAGVEPDPFVGDRLETMPRERFDGPWWYRRAFEVDRSVPWARYRLDLDGVSYSADVWLNGVRIAAADRIAGAFRRFRLDVTDHLVEGTNLLAIEVFPAEPGDLAVGFVDWNPPPPDRSLGLWRGVSLSITRAVELDDVFVETDLGLDGDLDSDGARPAEPPAEARLTVSARLANLSTEAVSGTLRGEIDGRRFEQPFALAPRAEQRVVLRPAEHPELVVERPRLWWPADLGEPALYELRLAAAVDGGESDAERVRFGIREVSDYTTPEGHRGYRVNGRPVAIRGAGWVDDLLLREDPRRVEDQIRYARQMNLNTLRLEGFWGSSQTLYDLADRYGLLILPGWSCQWEWDNYFGGPVDEFGGLDSDREVELAVTGLADQVTWLRNHPSVLAWLLGSDMLPRAALERRYLDSLERLDPTRPLLASCAVRTSEVSGPTGVKMNGPYDYVTPNYWYQDREHGGAFGFATEIGPGPQPPPLESLRRMLPADHLWPIDQAWEYRCARGRFDDLDRFTEALDRRYGPARGVEEYAVKAQLASYETERAMFEAYAVRRPAATGVVQWMFNSAWPAMYWQLFDYYLMPNGAFYGTRAAGRPLSLVYDYADGTVWAVDNTLEPAAGLVATVRVLDLASRVVHEETATVDLVPGRAAAVTRVAPPPGTPVYFVDLRLARPGGEPIATSFYWLSAKPDVLDLDASTWYHTPNRSFADLTALSRLPAARLAVDAEVEPAGEGAADEEADRVVHATLRNDGPDLAFFVELRAVDAATGDTVLPVLWDDNYVSLLPGETRRLTATLPHAGPGAIRLDYSGWNVAAGSASTNASVRRTKPSR